MRKNIILMCLVAFLLPACVPTAFVAGAAATGFVLNDKRSAKVIFRDNEITYKIQSRIMQNKILKNNADISVATYNGVVLLTGQASKKEFKDHITQLASTVPGVKKLHNQVVICGSITLTDEANDAWITTKVKTALLNQSGFESTQLKVITNNRAVYLMGKITPVQGENAAKIASQVPGVLKVVKVFEY